MNWERPEYLGFDWDAGNRDQNLRHDVNNGECEQFFFNEPLIVLDDPRHSMLEHRLAAFGQTGAGRKLIVIFTIRGSLIRVISARAMSLKERRYYEKESQA